MRETAKEFKKHFLFKVISKFLKEETYAEAIQLIELALLKYESKVAFEKLSIDDVMDKDDKREKIKLDDVEENICTFFNVTPEQLNSGFRGNKIPDKRDIYLYFCYQFIHLPTPNINELTPGKHRSKFYHARTKCKNPFLLYQDYFEFVKFMNTKYKLKIVKR